MMRRLCDNRTGSASRRFLVWLFCAALLFSALPVLPAACAVPADCGTASGAPCCGCCAPADGGAMLAACATPPEGPIVRGGACEMVEPAAPVSTVRAPQPRSSHFVPDNQPATVTSVVRPTTSPPVVRHESLIPSTNGPPGHFPSTQPGRAPPRG